VIDRRLADVVHALAKIDEGTYGPSDATDTESTAGTRAT